MKPLRRACAARRAAAVTLLMLMLMLTPASLPVRADTHLVPLRWSASGAFEHRATVADGRFVEVCGALPLGAEVGWRFKLSEPAEFNIHYHVGKDVVYPVKLPSVREAAQTLRVASKEDHCWMWTNRSGRPMEVWVRLERAPAAAPLR